jgi:hypothetical protein
MAQEVREVLRTKKWLTVEQIQRELEGSRGVRLTLEQIRGTLRTIKRSPTSGDVLQEKNFGEEESNRPMRRYRIEAREVLSPVQQLCRLLEPVLAQLEEMGQMHAACMSPMMIRVVAERIRQALACVSSEKG